MSRVQQTQRLWAPPAAAWYTATILLFAYTVAFIDRAVLSMLVEPMRRDLSINDTQVGLLAGFAFVIFYVGLGVPLGLVADRWNRKYLITISVLLWSTMTAACGLARTFASLFVARVGVGIGEAGLSPASYSLIADLFPSNRRGAPLGLYNAAIYVGSGLALIIGAAVVARVSHLGIINLALIGPVRAWKLVFFVVAVPGFLVALLMTTVREPIRHTHSAVDNIPSLQETMLHIRSAGRVYLLHFLAFGFLAAPSSIFFLWARPFLTRRFGLPPADAGYLVGLLLTICATTGMMVGSMFSDVLQSRGLRDGTIRVGLISSSCLIVPLALLGVLPTIRLALLDMGIILFFAAFAFGAAPAALQLVTPNRIRAVVSGLYLLTLNLIGATAAPAITGALTDYVFHNPSDTGWSIAIVGSANSVLATLFFVLLRRPFLAALSETGVDQPTGPVLSACADQLMGAEKS